MPEFFFWTFATLAVVSALGVVFSPQAIHSACWMFALLLCLSTVMASLGAWLLGLLTLLVYAGAILVLFVFVIMFLGQRPPGKQIGRWRLGAGLLALVACGVGFLPLVPSALQPMTTTVANSLPRTALYGTELFGRYQLLTLLSGWVLLWVMVGALNISNTPAHKEASHV